MIPHPLHQQHRERAVSMSNTKMRRNIFFAVVAVILAVTAFAGCRTVVEPEAEEMQEGKGDNAHRFALDTKYAQIGYYLGYAEFLGPIRGLT